MGNHTGACEVLHNSESGINEHKINGNSWSYANELARYIRCPTTIRVRVLEQYDVAPSLDAIRNLQSKHGEQRAKYRAAWNGLGERPEDHVSFQVGTYGKPARGKPRIQNPVEFTPPPEMKRPVGIPHFPSEIIASIAMEFHLKPEDMTSTGRQAKLMKARQTAIYVLRNRGNSYPQIGRWMGGKDHASMIHHFHKFEQHATPGMREIASRYLGSANEA